MNNFLWKNKNFLFYIFMFFLTITSCFILIHPIIKINNINEYFTYLKTGCNISTLEKFTQNCSEEEKIIFYNYLKNLLIWKPIGITSKEISNINSLLNITFIKIYNWKPLIIVSTMWFFLLVNFIIFLLKTKNKLNIIYI